VKLTDERPPVDAGAASCGLRYVTASARNAILVADGIDFTEPQHFRTRALNPGHPTGEQLQIYIAENTLQHVFRDLGLGLVRGSGRDPYT
jgi:hypothetical protein